MMEGGFSTYIAGGSAVLHGLLNNGDVVGQGVTSGHGVLVGLFVPVLCGIKTIW